MTEYSYARHHEARHREQARLRLAQERREAWKAELHRNVPKEADEAYKRGSEA